MFARRVSSRRILACRDTLAAGLLTQLSGLDPEPARDVVDVSGLPAAMSVKVLSAADRTVLPLRATDLDELHDQAVGRAWRDGAWDLQVSLPPPLVGVELGLVTAHADYDADPGLRDILVDAAERGRLVGWSWRPMRDGPEVRVRAHAAKDASLSLDHGRAGDPPTGLARPEWAWRKSRDWTIRLGRWSEEFRPATSRPRPATAKQRTCIVALSLAAGRRPRIPAGITLQEAIAEIDRLRSSEPGRDA